MKIGGLDIGTTGCKLTVFDENGAKLGKAYRDYPVRRAVSGHEIDISTMMESVYAVIVEMAAQYPDIAGIGVTSFGETFVMTDEAGNPLHNAMLYTDKRGAEECAELAKECCKRMQGIENNARLAKEVADVTIIAEQIVLAFRLDAEVDYWRGVKLERLRRLTEERRNPTPETNPPQGG